MKIILASKSPRRKEILENLGIQFEIITADTDESSEINDPESLVKELALRKGEAVADLILSEGICKDEDRVIVISSDTVVSADKNILGKPEDLENARKMLSLLQGRDHSVFSGIAVIDLKNGSKSIEKYVGAEETVVRFSPMNDDEIDFYIHAENVLDKAGAYAIQGIASAWIEKIDGDYFNVVGLPVRCLMKLFSEKLGLSLEKLRGE